jgi:hypothetical protein
MMFSARTYNIDNVTNLLRRYSAFSYYKYNERELNENK